MESVGVMAVFVLPSCGSAASIFLEGKGVRTCLVGHRKGRGLLFEVDDVVVVPTLGPFHHDVVMHEVGVLVNDDMNGTATKEDA